VRLSNLDFGSSSLESRGASLPNRRLLRPLRRSKPYSRSMDPDRIESPTDLESIWVALQQEAYFQISINKHIGLCLRHGWEITGTEEADVSYIRKRLTEIATVSGVPSNDLVRSIVRNAILYSNAFLVKVRDESRSSGKAVKREDKLLEPIAGYFPQNPRSITAEKNKWGKLSAWRQGDASKDKVDALLMQLFKDGQNGRDGGVSVFAMNNVVHFAYNREEGIIFGSPLWGPAIEDINALRRMEEDVEHLIRENAFPIKQWKVGDEFQRAESEDLEARRVEINNSEPGETYVTGHNEAIEVIGTNRGMDPAKSLEHFEERVFSGLNVSAVELGRGGTANRGTATSMVQQRIETCKDFQKVVEQVFHDRIIVELLAERDGRAVVPSPVSALRVALKFREIDIDAEISKATHLADLYSKNVVTRTEVREGLGLDPNVDEDDLMLENVTLKVAAVSAAAGDDPSPDTKNHPTNQHGTKRSNGTKKNDVVMSVTEEDFPQVAIKSLPSGTTALEARALANDTATAWRHSTQVLVDSIHSSDEVDISLLPYLLQATLVDDCLDHLANVGDADSVLVGVSKFLDDFSLGKPPEDVEDMVGSVERIQSAYYEMAQELFVKTAFLNRAKSDVHVIVARDSTCQDFNGQLVASATYADMPPHHAECQCQLHQVAVADSHVPQTDPVPSLNDILDVWVPDQLVEDLLAFPRFDNLSEYFRFLVSFLTDRAGIQTSHSQESIE